MCEENIVVGGKYTLKKVPTFNVQHVSREYRNNKMMMMGRGGWLKVPNSLNVIWLDYLERA